VNPGHPGRGDCGLHRAFARRIAAFGKVAVVGIKKPVDVATLPENDEFAPRAAGLLRRRQQPLSGLRLG